MAMTAGVMAALGFAFERNTRFVWDATSLGALVYLAVFGSVVAFTLYFWLLSHMPAKRLALISFVIPIVAVGGKSPRDSLKAVYRRLLANPEALYRKNVEHFRNLRESTLRVP